MRTGGRSSSEEAVVEVAAGRRSAHEARAARRGRSRGRRRCGRTGRRSMPSPEKRKKGTGGQCLARCGCSRVPLYRAVGLRLGWLVVGGWRCVALVAGGLAVRLASKILICRPAVERTGPANQGRTRQRMSDAAGVCRCGARAGGDQAPRGAVARHGSGTQACACLSAGGADGLPEPGGHLGTVCLKRCVTNGVGNKRCDCCGVKQRKN